MNSIRAVFLDAQPPHRPWCGASAVSQLVHRRLGQSGYPAQPWRGAHLFRYTVASQMVNAGVSFKDVADPSARIETTDGKDELVLTGLDKLDDPPSLVRLREAVNSRLPRVDLPEILLEIAARTEFTSKFTHLSERESRVGDLATSICAVLIAEACNIGLEPLVRNDVAALRRSRLSWVNQNFIRNETLTEANACLVSAQNRIPLVQAWGGGEVASAVGFASLFRFGRYMPDPIQNTLATSTGVTYLQSHLEPVHRLERGRGPRHHTRQPVPVGSRSRTTNGTPPDRDHDRYRCLHRCSFRIVLAIGIDSAREIADIGGARYWRIDASAEAD